MSKYLIIHFLRSTMVVRWLIALLAVTCVIGGSLPSDSSCRCAGMESTSFPRLRAVCTAYSV